MSEGERMIREKIMKEMKETINEVYVDSGVKSYKERIMHFVSMAINRTMREYAESQDSVQEKNK